MPGLFVYDPYPVPKPASKLLELTFMLIAHWRGVRPQRAAPQASRFPNTDRNRKLVDPGDELRQTRLQRSRANLVPRRQRMVKGYDQFRYGAGTAGDNPAHATRKST